MKSQGKMVLPSNFDPCKNQRIDEVGVPYVNHLLIFENISTISLTFLSPSSSSIS